MVVVGPITIPGVTRWLRSMNVADIFHGRCGGYVGWVSYVVVIPGPTFPTPHAYYGCGWLLRYGYG